MNSGGCGRQANPALVSVHAPHGCAPAVAADSPTHSPYAGEESREIKALAPDFIKGLKAGAGLGFAKSAELNGYPGPAHLLELQAEIPLNAEQTQAIFAIRD